MPQRLQQADDTVFILGRAEEDRHDQVRSQIAHQIVIDLVRWRNDILQKFGHQPIVEIGQRFQKRAARRRLILAQHLGQSDQVRGFVRVPFPRPLADQIDMAGDLAARIAHRDFAQDQGAGRNRLQGMKGRPNRSFGQVHLVDIDQMRNGAVIKEFQDR